MLKRVLLNGTVVCMVAGAGWAAPPVETLSVEAMLNEFVEAYVDDPMLVETTFGIKILPDDWWHVHAQKATEDKPAEVSLHQGEPEKPAWYFTVDGVDVLKKVYAGELDSETAAVKAFSTDYAPMDMEIMEGYEPGPGFVNEMFHTSFHFFNPETPEIINFGEENTRFTHGADVVVFYYQEGFRSSWFSMKPGQHANEDPRSQVNPFPSLLLATKNKAKARIGGKEIILKEGEAVLIPPGITHEFWNSFDDNFEGFLFMFGEGA